MLLLYCRALLGVKWGDRSQTLLPRPLEPVLIPLQQKPPKRMCPAMALLLF